MDYFCQMIRLNAITIILGVLLGFTYCQSKTQEADQSLIKLPAHFPPPVYNYDKNPLSKEGIALGRRLFFDPILSKDRSVACGSCHHPSKAYSDAEKRFSIGIKQQTTKRNSPGLFNLLWHQTFFADGGVRHFELIPLAPLVNRQEMDGDLKALVNRLKNNRSYQQQFHQAFHTDSIQSKHVLYALAQFIGSLISANAPYDQFLLGETKLSIEAQKGLQIFRQKCSNCHSTKNQLFTDLSYRNNGLDSLPTDDGRFRITENPKDRGLFKVPSLRNVMLTAPYMHDGRFRSIYEVLQHYNQGVRDAPTLDQSLKNNQRLGIPLTISEQKAVVAFLHTLTDSSFVNGRETSKPSSR